MKINNSYQGIMVCKDRLGRRIQRIIATEEMQALPKVDEPVEVEGETMTVVGYIPPTRVVVEVDLNPEGDDRAMIRYHLANGRWGCMIYGWREGEAVLLRGWRDGYDGFTAALQAAFEAYRSL
jgi:hypothetical protein